MTLGLGTAVASFFSFLAYLSYTPSVHKNSPAFTSDTSPFIGSTGFTRRQWQFWRKARDESKTGNFSFWLGNRHVVGVTGEAARKMFFETQHLDFVSGIMIRPLGVYFWPEAIHDVYKPGFHNGRSNTYFLRRMLEIQKTEQLVKYLPRLLRDARDGCDALARTNPSGVVVPVEAYWRTVFKQDFRLFCTDEIADNPDILEEFSHHVQVLLYTVSHYNVSFPWLLCPSWVKRRYSAYKLGSILRGIMNKRTGTGAVRVDDPMQMLIDNGDRKDWILKYFVDSLFIAPANSRIMTGQMLNIIAIHTDWQERILGEVKAAATAHCKGRDLPLVDQLASIPLKAWESSFPSIDLCLKEAIRMWTSFSMARLNTSPDPIPIPGSNEVVPGNTFVCYNSTEVNFSEKLYPEPLKFDPNRFREEREEYKQEAFGFLGWGEGRHPCPGTRWAKLQQNIIFAYAMAMYEWTPCDAKGQPNPLAVHKRDLNTPQMTTLPQAFCKWKPRNKI